MGHYDQDTAALQMEVSSSMPSVSVNINTEINPCHGEIAYSSDIYCVK